MSVSEQDKSKACNNNLLQIKDHLEQKESLPLPESMKIIATYKQIYFFSWKTQPLFKTFISITFSWKSSSYLSIFALNLLSSIKINITMRKMATMTWKAWLSSCILLLSRLFDSTRRARRSCLLLLRQWGLNIARMIIMIVMMEMVIILIIWTFFTASKDCRYFSTLNLEEKLLFFQLRIWKQNYYFFNFESVNWKIMNDKTLGEAPTSGKQSLPQKKTFFAQH